MMEQKLRYKQYLVDLAIRLSNKIYYNTNWTLDDRY